MAVRGMLFAITPEERAALLSATGDDAKIEYLQEEIEEAWDKEHLCELDKAWHCIHLIVRQQDRSEEGTQLPDPKGDPAAFAICGSRLVLENTENYMIGLVEPEDVVGVSDGLAAIDEATFKARYEAHCRDVEPEYDDDGLEDAWEYFRSVRQFYKDHVGSGRTVIFSVDF